MRAATPLVSSAPASGRQLALPFTSVALPISGAVPTPLGVVRPRRVWASLAPTDRMQVQRTCQRICKEVAHDAARRP
jgi:hypothetical protein